MLSSTFFKQRQRHCRVVLLSELTEPFLVDLHLSYTMSKHRNSTNPTRTGDFEKTHNYDGSGTEEDPFVVEFPRGDPSNPMNWSQSRKWFITVIVTMSVFIVTMTSSAPSSSSRELISNFNISRIEFILSVSLFVLGFAIGPAFWGPMVRASSFLNLALLFCSSFHPGAAETTFFTRAS
jgi:hypothetical protein